MIYQNKENINIGGEMVILLASFIGIIYSIYKIKEGIKNKNYAMVIFITGGLCVCIIGFVLSLLGFYQFYAF